MGNSDSYLLEPDLENQNAHIILSQPYYVLGEHIKGHVILNLSKPYPLRKLEIRLQGLESFNVYSTQNKRKICDIRFTLEEAQVDPKLKTLLPKILDAGKHEYNFAFCIKQENMPTASTFYKSSCIEFYSGYKLIAYVTSFVNSAENIKITKKFELLEPLRSIQNVKTRRSSNVKSLISTQGTSILNVDIDYTGFVIPAGMELSINFDNTNCNIDVKNIQISLIQHIEAIFNEYAKPIIEEQKICEWNLDGVKKNESIILKKRLKIEGNCNDFNLETCKSKNFKITYMMKIEPIYDLLFCKDKPSMKIDINLTNKYRGKDRNLLKNCEKNNNEELKVPDKNSNNSYKENQEIKIPLLHDNSELQ